MLEFLKGNVLSREIEYFVLDMKVVGFRVYCSQYTMNRAKVSEEILVYTYFHVREDNMQIFGFTTKEERYMFEMLISVSGIGPKVAMAVLSTYTPDEVAFFIVREDVKAITKVKGLGKKGASRLVLELKDKMKKIEKSDDLELIGNENNQELSSNRFEEAVQALIVLGYRANDAKSVISKIYDEEMKVEDIVKKALKQML